MANTMSTETIDHHATAKVLVAWAGTAVGALTLQQWVLIATLIYTVLQIFVALRRLLGKRPGDGEQ